MSLPTADDLFRPTAPEGEQLAAVRAVPDPATVDQPGADDSDPADDSRERRPSGRVRHDEKMTVYVTSDELLDLEHARLTLRREHGLAVDRGRMVRVAVSLVLADLEARGVDSALIRRLTEE